MNVIKTELNDVYVIEPKIFGDDRGFFFESYQKDRYAQHGIHAEFIQDNVSYSAKGVLRGLHCQTKNPQAKLVSVLQGQVYDVALDLRPESSSFGKYFGTILSAENKKQLWIPRGFAHGFLVMSHYALFCYKCDNLYTPEAEISIAWNDPQIAIDWPDIEPQLSEKDLKGMKFSEIDLQLLAEFKK